MNHPVALGVKLQPTLHAREPTVRCVSRRCVCRAPQPPTVVLACRDLRRGDALKATLEQEAAACNTNPTIEVRHERTPFRSGEMGQADQHTHIITGAAAGCGVAGISVALSG